MARQPSADPFRLILGSGTRDYKEDYLSNIEPRDKQLWFVENSAGEIVDIEKYDTDSESWVSLLGEFVRSVSGIEVENGNIPQVVKVNGPSPGIDGKEKQLGYDPDREELFVYENGVWRMISTIGSGTGITQQHSLNPTEDQVNDPASAPNVSETGSSGSVESGDHQWLVTFVCGWGETANGPSSSVLTVSDGEVELTNIPIASEDVVSDRYIYRTKAGGDTFYYVDNIGDNTTESYIDSTSDAGLGSEAPTDNKTEAHKGDLPESFISFDASAGHNHDGANSREAIVQPHDISGSKHTGNYSFDNLVDVPDKFTPEDHDVNPSEGPHTGGLPWSQLENVPAIATDPHTNAAHENDFALDPHNNDQHSETYITSAMERIRYGAGQLGEMSAQSNLQPPVPIDVAGEVVKVYALSRVAPDANVSGTVYVSDDSHGEYFTQTITLPSGNTIETDTSNAGTDIYDESIVRFSLDDDNSVGEDFAIYLIVKTEIGS